jgi:hypothetical protein
MPSGNGLQVIAVIEKSPKATLYPSPLHVHSCRWYESDAELITKPQRALPSVFT